MQVLEDRMLLTTGIFRASDIVAASGDAMPADNNGNFNGNFDWFLEPPTLNNAGQAIFEGREAYGPQGLYWASATQPITLIIRHGQEVPASFNVAPGATFDSPVGGISLAFNDNGQTVFDTAIDADGTVGDRQSYIGSTTENMALISSYANALNNSGQIAFGTINDIAVDDGIIFRTDASGNLVQIVREGDAIPFFTSPDTFTGFGFPAINESGQVAFVGATGVSGFGAGNLDGIYVGDGTTLKTIAQEGAVFNQASGERFSSGGGSTGELSSKTGLISINNNGEVAFSSGVDDGNILTGEPISIFVGSGATTVGGTLVVRKVISDGASIGNGETLLYEGGTTLLNEKGDVVFRGKSQVFEGFTLVSSVETIFIADSNGNIKQVARDGQSAPGGGTFYGLVSSEVALNDCGQLGFTAGIDTNSDGIKDEEGLFFYDEILGLKEIVRTGDLINGSEIFSIEFAANDRPKKDGLNNKGQVAFTYQLGPGLNDPYGIAIVSVADRSNCASPVISSSIAGYTNGNWWVSSPDASGNYTTSQWASGQTSPVKVLKGDFNGDGLQDVAAWLPNGEWQVGLANSVDKTFTFQKWTRWRTSGIKEIQVGDFNGDGRDDIAGLFKRGSKGDWWVAQSDGTRFVATKWGTYGNYNGIATVVTGDFDGTSRDDIAVMASNGRWWIYASQGSSFNVSSWTKWKITSGVNNLLVGDFDGNGKDDIAGLFGTGIYRNWWVGLSTGSSFANRKWSTWKVSTSLDGVVAGDFNGDGATDIAGFFSKRDWWVGLADTNTNKFVNQKWATWSLVLNEQLADIQVGSSNGDSNADIFARREDGRWIALESTGTAFSTRTLTRWSSTANWQNVQIGRFYRPAIGAAAAPAAFTVEPDSKPQEDTVNTSRWVSPKENTNSERRTIPKQQSVLVRSEEELNTENFEVFGSAALLDLLHAV